MVLEQQIMPFLAWFQSHALIGVAIVLGLLLAGMFVGYLFAAVRNGPVVAAQMVGRVVAAAGRDLQELSWRRVLAMARLAFKESIRRYVLVVFAVFIVILLFAGWYLDVNSDNPGRLYISFVLKATNFLVVLLVVFLSAFSLPTDMKNKTIYTVVTKPVRPWEIVLGRIIGFSAIGTVILALMCLFSYIFVRRGLDHRHDLELASVQVTIDSVPNQDEPAVHTEGQTTRNSYHRHDVSTDGGTGTTDAVMGHFHEVTVSTDGNEVQGGQVSGPRGALQARVPIYGALRFLDRQGKPAEKGINIGKEWFYRGYIEGGTLAAGIWRFDGLRSRDFPKGLPLEMTIRVFRTYQGDIERGILGSMVLRNPNPAIYSSDPAVRAAVDKDTAVQSEPITFTATEFTPESRVVPEPGPDGRRGTISAQMLDGSIREVDVFNSLVHDGALEIVVQCEEKAQYYGMAASDLYLRAADRFFVWNFIKSYLTMWLQMVVVTSFGVMFSTFLTGAVAMLATIGAVVMGYFWDAILKVATGQAEGGGPFESLIRIFRQQNLTSELEASAVTRLIVQTLDKGAMFVMQGVSFLMPNFRDYAEFGGMNTTRFVAYGFDIPAALMCQHFVICLLYVLLLTCASYFFLKTKEIAA